MSIEKNMTEDEFNWDENTWEICDLFFKNTGLNQNSAPKEMSAVFIQKDFNCSSCPVMPQKKRFSSERAYGIFAWLCLEML